MSDATPSPAARYSTVAIALHWLLALAIIATLGVGLYVEGLPFSPHKLKVMSWHKWAGITILVLSAVRLLWRLTHPAPPLAPAVLAAMAPWQHQVHRGTHVVLYLLFFAVPLLGWAYSSSLGVPVVWFGVWPLPDWVPVNREFGNLVLKPLHKTAAYLLAAVALLHVAAALKHQFVDRDDLMLRMLPRSR
jgi:cytochrome b561